MSFFNKNRFSLRRVVIMLTIAFVGVAAISYAALTLPNTFTAGTTISASQVNQNFSTLASAMPGIKATSSGNVYLSSGLNLNGFDSSEVLASLTVTAPADGRYMLFTSGVVKTQTGIDNSSFDAALFIVTNTQAGPTTINGISLWGILNSNLAYTTIKFSGGNGLTQFSPISHDSPFSFYAVTPSTLAGATTTYHLAGHGHSAGPNPVLSNLQLIALFVPTDLN